MATCTVSGTVSVTDIDANPDSDVTTSSPPAPDSDDPGDTALPDAQRAEMITDVLEALGRMESTVNDVLDFKKLDADMFSMTRKPVVVRDMMEGVCRHGRAFLKPSVQLGYRVTPPDAMGMIDDRRMFQIIINGLSNAGKFTPSGAVAVDAVVMQDGFAGPHYLVVTVSNTNLGRPIASPEDLFVPFRGEGAGAPTTEAGTWCQ